jgi:hypothetical protein
MAAEIDKQDIKVGAWEFLIGATRLGLLKDEDVKIKADGNIIEAKAMITGKSTIQAFTGGLEISVSLKLGTEHKSILQRVYNFLQGTGLNPSNGAAGSLEFVSEVGRPIRNFTLTGYCIHWDLQGNSYTTDANNPHAVQLYNAFSKEAIEWMFNAKDTSSHDFTFIGIPNLDLPGNSTGKYGFVTLPLAGLIYASVTAPGTGYTSVPTVAVGTQWVTATPYTAGQQIASAGRLYTVTTTGTSGATAPTHTSGAVANGTATLTYVGLAGLATATIANGSVNQIIVSQSGSGYTSVPAISITGGAGTGATATAQIG